MDRLRTGAALFNAGHYLPAHEPWEGRWLDDERGEREECLQGLVQTTAAVHHARNGNWDGAIGLAESAVVYLQDCPSIVEAPIGWLYALAADPELAERERPPPIRIDGELVALRDLEFPAAAHAAEALAEARNDDVLSDAAAYAASDVADGRPTSPLVTLTLDYLDSKEPIVRRRLEDHVRRRRARDRDVDALFD